MQGQINAHMYVCIRAHAHPYTYACVSLRVLPVDDKSASSSHSEDSVERNRADDSTSWNDCLHSQHRQDTRSGHHKYGKRTLSMERRKQKVCALTCTKLF